jgi:broad specificity phosphatase PhoE
MLTSFAALLFLAVPDPLAALGPVPIRTVRVYLVRHGQALSNLEPPPPPSAAPQGLDHLTPLGEAQARAEVGERVMALVKGLRAEAPAASVALVAHGEVIAAFVGEIQGTPPAKRYPPRLANGSITVVEARPDGSVALLLANHVPPGMPSPTR